MTSSTAHTRLASLAVVVALAAAALVSSPRAAHAQDAEASVSAQVVVPAAPSLVAPQQLALQTELGRLRAERASIDFTAAHWLLGIGAVGTLCILPAMFTGAIGLVVGASGGGHNSLLDWAAGFALASVGGLVMLVAGAVWAGALSAQAGSVDARLRALQTSARFDLSVSQDGAVAGVTIPL